MSYTGGKAGPADSKLPPVYIGWVNQQGGANDIAPEATVGANFSVQYVNSHLGGVDGHPVRLVTCFIPDTVSAAAQCGQALANNKNVQQIVVGAPLTVGNQAFESALLPTHKLLNMFAGSPSDSSYKDAVWLYGSTTSLEGPLAQFMAKTLHAKTVAIVNENIPGTAQVNQAITDGLKLDHVKYTDVSFDPSSTDLTIPLEAAKAASADVIESNVSGPLCSDLYMALKQLGIKKSVLVNPPCIGPSIAAADGGSLPRWYYAIGSTLYGDSTDPAAAALAKAFSDDPAFAKRWGTDTWIDTTFSQMLTAVKFMNKVGPSHLTAEKLDTVALKFKGPMLWGPPKMVCGTFKNAPQVCLDEDQFFRPNARGVFVRVQSWLSKPAAEPING